MHGRKESHNQSNSKKSNGEKTDNQKAFRHLGCGNPTLYWRNILPEFGFTKDGFVKKAILEKISRDKISNMIDDMIQL